MLVEEPTIKVESKLYQELRVRIPPMPSAMCSLVAPLSLLPPRGAAGVELSERITLVWSFILTVATFALQRDMGAKNFELYCQTVKAKEWKKKASPNPPLCQPLFPHLPTPPPPAHASTKPLSDAMS
jgi:hypothetical protein